jgi:glycosyltransferase involved in cell wall biosynthesis
MRILHLIYDDLDNPWVGGGGAARTLEIYRRIAAKEHRVVVGCGWYPGAPARRVRDGVRYRHLGRGGRSHVASRLGYMRGAARLIKRGGYDIVIEDVSPFSPVFASMLSRAVPAVASVQNLSGRHATAKHGLPGWGPRLVEWPLLRSYRHFVAVSPGIAEEIRRTVPGANVAVVPNSAHPAFFAPPPPDLPDTFEAAANLYILSLGRIDVYQKGLDHLIAAFDLVAEQHTGLELLIAGGGTAEQQTRLRELVVSSQHQARVRLLGEVPPEHAARLMRGALLLAMPSRYEAWPLTAIEAGAAGTPVVGSDIVGVRDAAPPYPRGHGLLPPEGDAPALAAAITRLIDNPDLRRELGAAGKAWAARFTWDALAEQQLRFYEQVMGIGSR